MLGYVLAVFWLGLAAVFLTQWLRPSTKGTKRLLLLISAVAMLAMAVVQIHATREHDLAKVELARINLELDRIKQEVQSGRPFSAKELQDRDERLQKLKARLNARGR